jgi:hypothetical protein
MTHVSAFRYSIFRDVNSLYYHEVDVIPLNFFREIWMVGGIEGCLDA